LEKVSGKNRCSKKRIITKLFAKTVQSILFMSEELKEDLELILESINLIKDNMVKF
jgi:hypothetical protein